MQNQIGVVNQNAQQIGENPINHPAVTQEKRKINYWMILTIILIFLLLGVSGSLFFTQKSQKNRVDLTQPTITPASIKETNMPSIPAVESTAEYSSWKSVEDDYLGIRFKIPQGQNYSKTEKIIYPSKVIIGFLPYSGGSRREEVLRTYRLSAKDVRIEETTTNQGKSVLLLQGITDIAEAEGMRYLGILSSGSYLLSVGGDKTYASLIDGIIDTFETISSPPDPSNMAACMGYDENLKWSNYGKRENGDYFVEIYSRSRLDENYLKKSGNLDVKAQAWRDYKSPPPDFGTPGEMLVEKDMPFSVEVADYGNLPYVQKLVFTVGSSTVEDKFGKETLSRADGIQLLVNATPLKTADGKFCQGIGGLIWTKTIK